MGYLSSFRTVTDTNDRQNFIKELMKSHCLIAVFIFLLGGSLNAQTEYQILSDNDDLEKEYYDELDKWMLRAYEGDREAQFKVGVLFASDQFDKPNAEQAVYWYKQAARQDHILAQYNLGHHLLAGNGVEKNDISAIQWWQEAAKEDHPLAQFNVGRAYYLGIGVAQDHQQSRYWFSRAAQNNEEKSIDVLQQLGWDDDLVASNQPSNINQQPPANINQQPAATINQQSTETTIDQPTLEQLKPRIVIAETSETTITAPTSTQNSETIASNEPGVTAQIVDAPVALYTNPEIRSVLITIVGHRESLDIIAIDNDWVTVRSPVGFPVWVHGNYVRENDNSATVVGTNVNARSVPIVSNGTIVGTLDGGEELNIIDKQNEWYRLTSPTSFVAWIKTEDYNRPAYVKNVTDVAAAPNGDAPEANDNQKKELSVPAQSLPPASLNSSIPMADINDNKWLFNQAKDSFTLQLASFDEQQKVNEFLSNNSFSSDSELHRFTSASLDITWTYFLYGNYSDQAAAQSAKENLKQKNAWIRTFGRLQENRCLSWKTKLPTPPELNQYCNQ